VIFLESKNKILLIFHVLFR
jgi:hypothetical protein